MTFRSGIPASLSRNANSSHDDIGRYVYLFVNHIVYFRFLSIIFNQLRNKLLANYLRNGSNDLATVRISAFCVAMLSNNSFFCKENIFFESTNCR